MQHTATQFGRPLRIMTAVEAANDAQKLRLVEKIVGRLGEDLTGRSFALWGCTAEHRRARGSVEEIIAALIAAARIVAYDPWRCPKRAALRRPDSVAARQTRWMQSRRRCARRGTEWQEFRSPDFDGIARALRTPPALDGRISTSLRRFAPGLEYFHRRPCRRWLPDFPISTGIASASARALSRATSCRSLLVGDVDGSLPRRRCRSKIARSEEGPAARQRRLQRGARRATTLVRRQEPTKPARCWQAPPPTTRTSFHRDTDSDDAVAGHRSPAATPADRLETAPSHEVLANNLRLRAASADADLVILITARAASHIATMIERAPRAAGAVDPKGDE